MEETIKPGDRVTFTVVLPDGRTGQGAGIVTRLSPTNQPMIQPEVNLPFGSRMSNIQKLVQKRA